MKKVLERINSIDTRAALGLTSFCCPHFKQKEKERNKMILFHWVGNKPFRFHVTGINWLNFTVTFWKFELWFLANPEISISFVKNFNSKVNENKK